MSDKRRLVYSILKFCNSELQSNELSDDAKESLEVGTSKCYEGTSKCYLGTSKYYLGISICYVGTSKYC